MVEGEAVRERRETGALQYPPTSVVPFAHASVTSGVVVIFPSSSVSVKW
jgi:hypothetical protein